MIAFHEVAIGSGGVAPCVRCGTGAVTRPHPAEEIVAALQAAAADRVAPGPNVVFTGFEPFAHPELPMLVAAAREAGFERIRLRTDAGALTRVGNAEGVIAAGVTQLEVVFLGGAGAHDTLTGRQGLHAAALAGMESFSQAARAASQEIAVSGLVPVCRHNAAHVPEALAALAQAGAVAVVVDTTCRPLDPDTLRSALDTATVSLLHIAVMGHEVEVPYDRSPSAVAGAVQ